MKMKNKLYISLLAVAALALPSCQRDVDNFMVDDTIGLMNPGLVEAQVFEGLSDPYKIFAVKSGKGFQGATVGLAVDNTVLDAYNADPETKQQLSALPEDCYQLSVRTLDFSDGDYRKPFEIVWDREKLKAALEADANLAIPVRLAVANTGVNIDEDRLTAVIKPTLTLPYLELKQYGFYTGVMPVRTDPDYSDIYLDVVSNFIAQQDIDFGFEIDEELMNQYNSEKGTDYELLPEEAYDLALTDWQIKKYMNTSRFKFRFFKEYLFPENEPVKYGNYMLPIKLTTTSSSKINPARNSILYTIAMAVPELKKKLWKVLDCNSCITEDQPASNRTPENLIDDDTGTIWQANPAKPLPYTISFDMGQDQTIYKFGYANPSGANRRLGKAKAGYVEIGVATGVETVKDEEGNDVERPIISWERLVDFEAISQTASIFEAIDVPQPKKGRYLRIVITEGYVPSGQGAEVGMAEINLYGD